MFREMRRSRQMLPQKETVELLEKATSGVLALLGDDDYPYAVPISYVYADGKLFFHAAKTGHKIDAIKKCEKASFCVIEQDEIIPEKYTTYFRSVIAFGKIRILEDEAEIRQAIRTLAMKYSAEYEDGIEKAVDEEFRNLCMIQMDIEHLTGKEAIELVKAKNR